MNTAIFAATGLCLLLGGCASTAEMNKDQVVQADDAPTALDFAINESGGGAAWTPPGTKPDKSINTLSGRKYFTPTPADKVKVFDPTTREPKEVYWAGLTQAEIVKLYDGTDEQVELEQVDVHGTASALPLTAEIKKSSYRVKYYYYRYRTQPCAEGTPGDGGIAIGTGLRITADVRVMKANANITGLMGLSSAVEGGQVKGKIRIQTFGLASGSQSVNTYMVASATDLSPEAIRKAVESFGVVKAVSDTGNVTLSPNYLFVESDNITKCLADLRPKT